MSSEGRREAAEFTYELSKQRPAHSECLKQKLGVCMFVRWDHPERCKKCGEKLKTERVMSQAYNTEKQAKGKKEKEK